MNIMIRYVTGKVFVRFVGALCVFSFILTMARLVKMADMVLIRGVDFALVAKMLLFMLCYLLVYVIPISIFIAVLLTFGEMHATNEQLAIRSAGISDRRIFRPSFLLCIAMTIFCLGLNLLWLPKAHYSFKNMLDKIKVGNPSELIDAGAFVDIFDGHIIYVEEFDDDQFSGITIYESSDGKKTRIINAARGTLQPAEESYDLVLLDGQIDDYIKKDADSGSEGVLRFFFKRYSLRLPLPSMIKKVGNKKLKDMDVFELRDLREKLNTSSIDPVYIEVEIWRRISLALGCMSLCLWAYPLSSIIKREEKSIYFGVTFVAIVLFYIMLAAGEALAVKGYVAPWAGLMAANICIGGSALIFLKDEIHINVPFLSSR